MSCNAAELPCSSLRTHFPKSNFSPTAWLSSMPASFSLAILRPHSNAPPVFLLSKKFFFASRDAAPTPRKGATPNDAHPSRIVAFFLARPLHRAHLPHGLCP